MTKEDEKELDQVTEAEAVEEAKEDETPQGGAETPQPEPPKAKAVKKDLGRKEKLMMINPALVVRAASQFPSPVLIRAILAAFLGSNLFSSSL